MKVAEWVAPALQVGEQVPPELQELVEELVDEAIRKNTQAQILSERKPEDLLARVALKGETVTVTLWDRYTGGEVGWASADWP